MVASPPDYGLPEDLAASLLHLESMVPPRRLQYDRHWREIIEDAVMIARDGWASSALALGWSVHDLYGIGLRDDWEFAGLAVWLSHRSIVALDANLAIVTDGETRRAFNRRGMGHGTHPTVVPVLLWQFGQR